MLDGCLYICIDLALPLLFVDSVLFGPGNHLVIRNLTFLLLDPILLHFNRVHVQVFHRERFEIFNLGCLAEERLGNLPFQAGESLNVLLELDFLCQPVLLRDHRFFIDQRVPARGLRARYLLHLTLVVLLCRVAVDAARLVVLLIAARALCSRRTVFPTLLMVILNAAQTSTVSFPRFKLATVVLRLRVRSEEKLSPLLLLFELLEFNRGHVLVNVVEDAVLGEASLFGHASLELRDRNFTVSETNEQGLVDVRDVRADLLVVVITIELGTQMNRE